MRYVIGASVSTDEIRLPDGQVLPGVLGGAGIYALAGVRLWTEQVDMVSGTGPAYLDRHRGWYEANGVATGGLTVRGEKTPITKITYYRDGSRLDAPDTGLEEFRTLDPSPDEIAAHCDGETRGVYVFRHWDPVFFQALLELRQRTGLRLMWEISEDAAIPENRDLILSALEQIDVFSINQKEAAQLYGGQSPLLAGRRLADACSGWVYLRRGDQGALLYAHGECFACPVQPGSRVVDVTGAGNSSSAAVLYGFCEQVPPPVAAAMGSVAAARCIAQYGPPPALSPAMARQANADAHTLSQNVLTWEE